MYLSNMNRGLSYSMLNIRRKFMEFLNKSKHKKYDFNNLDEIKDKLRELGYKLPFRNDFSPLFDHIELKNITIPNAFVIHPMEGCDGTSKGAPGELTFRRYNRFGSGGAGLIWFEATAVCPEGRANPRQLLINEENLEGFKRLYDETLKAAGKRKKPVIIVQLTHSGRYSRSRGVLEPVIAHHSKILDPLLDIPEDYPVITDVELERLSDLYVNAARLIAEAGFDGVDIKACHGYLVNELLASHTREDSIYGGVFENRERFLIEVVEKIKNELPDMLVSSRLNVYDAIPWPYGFGMKSNRSLEPDLTEPISLAQKLKGLGVEILNVATGNPYYNPHIERPYDLPVSGGYIPEEHPLVNLAENVKLVRNITKAVPDLKTVVSGITWIREYIPHLGAGMISEGSTNMIGVGRTAFAYPDFVMDILEKGRLVPEKLCITCSLCTQLMKYGRETGCVVRDKDVYAPILKEAVKGEK